MSSATTTSASGHQSRRYTASVHSLWLAPDVLVVCWLALLTHTISIASSSPWETAVPAAHSLGALHLTESAGKHGDATKLTLLLVCCFGSSFSGDIEHERKFKW